MAVIKKGFPGIQCQLSSAVRKAVFASATVTAISMGAPAALADTVECTPGNLGTAAAGSLIQCSGVFDESISYEVADLSAVEAGTEVDVPGDVTLILDRDTTAGNVSVSSTTPASGAVESAGSVVIENHGSIEMGGVAGTAIDPSLVKTFEDAAISYAGVDGIGNDGIVFDEIHESNDGFVVDGTEQAFTDPVSASDLVDYLDSLGIDGTSTDTGRAREELLQIVIAEPGEIGLEDVGAVEAKTDAGDIAIENTGDIPVGDGLSVLYSSTYALYEGENGSVSVRDENGDATGYGVTGTYRQVFVDGVSRASASAVGILAESNSGDISVENSGSISAGNIAKGISASSVDGNIDIENSGIIEAGDDSAGISARTALGGEVVYSIETGSSHELEGTMILRGDDKAIVYNHFLTTTTAELVNADSNDSVIEIANSGNISVGSGSVGIEAQNPSGEAIIIENSGDISVAGEGGSAIYANTRAGVKPVYVDSTEVSGGGPLSPGEGDGTWQETDGLPSGGVAYYMPSFFHPFFGQLPVKHNFYETDSLLQGFGNDEGDIVISNSGTIDIAEAVGANGIYAKSYGSVDIENTGDILVGKQGVGIHTAGVANTAIENSGSIELNGSGKGVLINGAMPNPSVSSIPLEQLPEMTQQEMFGTFDDDAANAEFAGFNGGTTVVNSGDIQGAVNINESIVFNENGAMTGPATLLNTTGDTGIAVSTTNANYLDLGGNVIQADLSGDTLEALYERGSVILDAPENLKLYTTEVVNTGAITLGDLSDGINAQAKYGDLLITNAGEISLGNGAVAVTEGRYNPILKSAHGITASSQKSADILVHNTENGVITTGDQGVGARAFSSYGSATVVNDGVINVGDGLVLDSFADVSENPSVQYERGSSSYGMLALSNLGYDSKSEVINNGVVNTGDNSVGIAANNTAGGFFFTEAFEGHSTVAENHGEINVGSGSIGVLVSGFESVYAHNTGVVTLEGGEMLSGFDTVSSAGMATFGDGGPSSKTLNALLLNDGVIEGGDTAIGIDAGARILSVAAQGENGSIVVGDDSMGMQSIGYNQARTVNQGQITTGDNSFGMRTYAIYADAYNSGDVSVGSDSVGIQVQGAAAYVVNAGSVTAGAGSTGISIYSAQTSATVVNEGVVETGPAGTAIAVAGDYGSRVYNSGVIAGSIVTGDGDDFIVNGVQMVNGQPQFVGGEIHLNDSVIDLGAGENVIFNEYGDIHFSGDSHIELGQHLNQAGYMANRSGSLGYSTINSVNGSATDTLTINGDVFFSSDTAQNGVLNVEMDSRGNSDQIIINGDLTVARVTNAAGDLEDASLTVVANPSEQGKGSMESGPVLVVNGEENAGELTFGGVGGAFEDTVLEAEMVKNGNGDWVISWTQGLSDLGAAANSVSHLSQSLWLQSAGNFNQRQGNQLGGEAAIGEGQVVWKTWANTFHSGSDMEVAGELAQQNLAFSQQVGGMQFGTTMTMGLAGGRLNVSPIIGLASADGNQVDQQSQAAVDATTYALNANWANETFYVDGLYQVMDLDADIRAQNSKGKTSGDGAGFSVEGGWNFRTESGLVVTPQAQYSRLWVDLDDFTSTDGNFVYGYDLGENAQTRLGVNLAKSFKMAEGVAMPYATLSAVDYRSSDNHNVVSNGVGFASDASGTGFQVDLGVNGQFREWYFKGGVGVHNGDVDQNGINAHFSVNRAW